MPLSMRMIGGFCRVHVSESEATQQYTSVSCCSTYMCVCVLPVVRVVLRTTIRDG